jgi:hypothetical protein
VKNQLKFFLANLIMSEFIIDIPVKRTNIHKMIDHYFKGVLHEDKNYDVWYPVTGNVPNYNVLISILEGDNKHTKLRIYLNSTKSAKPSKYEERLIKKLKDLAIDG